MAVSYMHEEEEEPIDDCSSMFLWLNKEENQLSIQLGIFVVTILLLWLSVSYCTVCVFGVLAISAVFCLQYRLMNLVLWASIIVLWLHGWRLGGNRGLSLSWE